MDYRGHLKSGALLGAIAMDRLCDGNLSNLSQLGVLSAGALSLGLAFGSGLPDIDHHKSLMAQKLRAVGWLVSRCFSHRGFTHSIAFSVVVYIAFMFGERFVPLSYVLPYRYFAFGTLFGVIVHILMDMFIGNGVKLLAPITDRRFGFLKIRSGSKGEKAFHKFLLFLFFLYFLFRTGLGEEILGFVGGIVHSL